MSYNIDGKIANQGTEIRLSGKVPCGKCRKLLPIPNNITIEVQDLAKKQIFTCASYIGTNFYIYETKSGRGVVYCSKYCRDKHNHRFIK